MAEPKRLDEPCPNCGELKTFNHGRFVHCDACGYHEDKKDFKEDVKDAKAGVKGTAGPGAP